MHHQQAVATPAERRDVGAWAPPVAWALCAASLVLISLHAVLAFLNGTLDLKSSFVFVAASCAVVGGLVTSSRPSNPVGWLFLGSAVSFSTVAFTGEYAVYGLFTEPGSLPLVPVAAWFSIWTGALGAMLLFVVLPLYFPDGRPVSPRWRLVTRWTVPVLAVSLAPIAFLPGRAGYDDRVENPLGIGVPEGWEGTLPVLSLVVVMALVLLAVTSLVARFRRSAGVERDRLKWFTLAAAVLLVWISTNAPLEESAPGIFAVLDAAFFSGLPIAAGVAILRHRLYDIDVVINRALVYGALTLCVVGIYVLIVGYLSALFRTESLPISLVATGLVAILFQPLREKLQRAVNRLTYGERDDPYRVLSRLGQRLDATFAPEAVLPTVVETVADALKVPHAEISLFRGGEEGGFESAARHGKPSGAPLVLPLSYGNEINGLLQVSPRAKGEPFSAADRRLLEDLARQAGVAAYAVRLTADLRRSREKLVLAREEERRRLRRDLHDGIGPQLAALALKIETARNKLSGDPVAKDLLSDLAERARAAISDVRSSVHALRPPALDELGLVPALKETAAQYSSGGLDVAVDAPEDLPPLPAAVEVAVYRIAQEAMTNVVRHANANSCSVRLDLDGPPGLLRLEIEDDGSGFGIGAVGMERGAAGVGLSSMRERAEELGGTLVVGPAPGSPTGTLVRAELPRGVLGQEGA